MSVREQILETATAMIAARGFDATSLGQIASAVGIRKPSILYHFASKDALRRAVLDRLLGHWSEVLPRLLMATAHDGPGRVEALLGELIAFFAADRDRARLLVRELLDRPAGMREYLRKYVAPWIDTIAARIRVAQRSGDVPGDVDPEAYVVQVIALTLSSLATAPETAILVDADDPEAAQARGRTELLRAAKVALFSHAGAAPEPPGRS